MLESQNGGLIESVLMPFDIYNDAAQQALTVLKQRFLYDEIEAEVPPEPPPPKKKGTPACPFFLQWLELRSIIVVMISILQSFKGIIDCLRLST